jgi:hypothetical protein
MAEQLVRRPEEVERLRLARDLGISYKRLHGWEPRTSQVGYDRDGDRVALADAWEIVTEVEVEWDDEERARLLALGRHDGALHTCGFHPDITSDKANQFQIEETACNVCKATDRYLRIQAHRDREFEQMLGDKPKPEMPRPSDGRTTRIRALSALEANARRGA